MPDRKFTPQSDPMAERNRVIKQRNIVLGLVLTFLALLFFAITVVKMKHPHMPHKTPPIAAHLPLGVPSTSLPSGAPNNGR